MIKPTHQLAPAAAPPGAPGRLRAAAARALLLAPGAPTRHLVGAAAAIVAVWTVAALVLAQQRWAAARFDGRDVGFGTLLRPILASMWLWAAFTPPIIALARRYPLVGPRWPAWLVAHAGLATAFAIADANLMYVLLPLAGDGDGTPPLRYLFFSFFSCLSAYFVVASVAQAVDFLRLYQERRAAAAGLAAELARARLTALTAQLRPHFLFNTLNAIAGSIHVNPHAADRMVVALGSLLRRSMASDAGTEVRLDEELSLVEDYLEIMQLRLGARLRCEVSLTADVADALVPALLLQPLVENAIRHGIEHVATGGTVRIDARAAAGRLVLTVADDGAGMVAAARRRRGPGGGVGLDTTRQRLAQLHGPHARLDLAPRAPQGTVATVTLPLRRLVVPGRRAAAAEAVA